MQSCNVYSVNTVQKLYSLQSENHHLWTPGSAEHLEDRKVFDKYESATAQSQELIKQKYEKTQLTPAPLKVFQLNTK